MRSKGHGEIIPSKGEGIFYGLASRIKLILRLLADRRINFLLKLLPIGSLVYLLIPDLAPGPIDDAAVIWLGFYLFVELCPPEIVQEHLNAIKKQIPGELKEQINEEDIIEADFWEED